MKPDGPRDYARDLEVILGQTEERAERAQSLISSDQRKRIITAITQKWGDSPPPDWIMPRVKVLAQKMSWESVVQTIIQEIEAA